MTRTNQLLAAASALAMSALAASPAFAAGTAAGSNIVNNVTVNYQVGGVSQTAVAASNTFVVDRKISLTVIDQDGVTTPVSPGQTNAVTTFRVTNTSNATLDLGLSIVQQVGGAGAHANTDNFDATTPTIWINTGPSVGSATYDPANSVQVTYLDDIAADGFKYVFVLGSIPIARVTGDVAAVTLTAQALNPGALQGSLAGVGVQGSVATNDSGTANNAATTATPGMDTVFADTAGATDAVTDGRHSAKDDWTVSAAALTVTKLSKIISDPISGTTNPKMIPGATVEYCIQVANAAGGSAATSVAISDPLPSQTTYDSVYGIFLNGTVTGGVCNTNGTAGGSFSAGTVSGTLASVAAGATSTLYFRATVN